MTTANQRPVRVGLQLQPQHAAYATIRSTAVQAEEPGVDTLFNWDHFHPLYGERDGLDFRSPVRADGSIITRQTIRRGSFTLVRQLTDTIGAFIDHWSGHPHPFAWTKDADEILDKITTLRP